MKLPPSFYVIKKVRCTKASAKFKD